MEMNAEDNFVPKYPYNLPTNSSDAHVSAVAVPEEKIRAIAEVEEVLRLTAAGNSCVTTSSAGGKGTNKRSLEFISNSK
jgi:hypothetical protein